MVQLQHVERAYGDPLRERLARAAIVEDRLAVLGKARLVQRGFDVRLAGAIEHRRLDAPPELARRPAEMRLEDLADVHAARHAERIEHDVGMGAVLKERHVFDRNDP
jgi:hypothetical protein